MSLHPNLQALTQLPPPRERTIHKDIPIYYLQVPVHYVAKVRGPDAPDPPRYVVFVLLAYTVLIFSLAIAGALVSASQMLTAFAHGNCRSKMAQ
jgi:hypothetical protein